VDDPSLTRSAAACQFLPFLLRQLNQCLQASTDPGMASFSWLLYQWNTSLVLRPPEKVK
jgi:hypothetical protein